MSRLATVGRRTAHYAIAGIGVYQPAAEAADAPRITGADCLGVSYRVQAKSGLNTASLAAGAARAALQASSIDPGDIELIVVGTTTPDVLWPTTACLVQGELALPMVASFDLYAAEASVLTALDVAGRYMAAGARAALVIGAESANQLVDFPGQSGGRHPRAAAAAVLSRASADDGAMLTSVSGGVATRDRGTDARQQVTIDGISRSVTECLRRADLELADIDLVIAEQTAPALMRSWASGAGVPGQTLLLEPERYAAAFAAAPFIALHDAVKEGRLQPRMTALLVSCGSGPIWAAACLRWGDAGIAEW